MYIHVVSYVELSDMGVLHSGDRAISLSGYNSTIRNISVEGNGCGGIGMSGGDQVPQHTPNGTIMTSTLPTIYCLKTSCVIQQL